MRYRVDVTEEQRQMLLTALEKREGILEEELRKVREQIHDIIEWHYHFKIGEEQDKSR